MPDVADDPFDEVPSLTSRVADPLVDGSTVALAAPPAKPLASFFLDDSGMLGCHYEAIQKHIDDLAKAINAHSEQLEGLVTATRVNSEAVSDVEKNQLAGEARVSDCEEGIRSLKVELHAVHNTAKKASAPKPVLTKKEPDTQVSDAWRSRCNALAERLQSVEESMAEESERLQLRFDDVDRTILNLQALPQTIEALEEKVRDGGEELEALRGHAADQVEKRCGKLQSDVGHLRGLVDAFEKELGENRNQLTGAEVNFVKLETVLGEVKDNTSRTKEVWRQFRTESQEFRSWVAHLFDVLRGAIHAKTDLDHVATHMDELRREVRDLAPHMVSEASQRVEADFRGKADVADLVKLRGTVEELARAAHRNGQLLIGKKCLACDRPVTSATFSDQGRIQLERSRQEGDFFREVEMALAESDSVRKKVMSCVSVCVGRAEQVAIPGAVCHTVGAADGSPGSHTYSRIKTRTSDGTKSSPRRTPTIVHKPLSSSRVAPLTSPKTPRRTVGSPGTLPRLVGHLEGSLDTTGVLEQTLVRA